MNTPQTDPIVQCYCCGAAAPRSTMQNLKGHDACPACVTAALNLGPAGADGPISPAGVQGFNPDDLKPGDWFQVRSIDPGATDKAKEWCEPYKFKCWLTENPPKYLIKGFAAEDQKGKCVHHDAAAEMMEWRLCSPPDYARPVPRRDGPTGPDGPGPGPVGQPGWMGSDGPGPGPVGPPGWVGFIDPAFSGADKSMEGIMYMGPMKPGPDPKGAAGLLKAQLQLIPPALNVEVAKALQNGANKYGPWNWRQDQVEVMTYIGAMRRHIDAFLNGEDTDPDSGTHHLGCVAASCAIVMDAAQFGNLIDNRPPPQRLKKTEDVFEGLGEDELCPTTEIPLANLKNEFKSNYFSSKEELIKALNDFRDRLRAKTPSDPSGTSTNELPAIETRLLQARHEYILKNGHAPDSVEVAADVGAEIRATMDEYQKNFPWVEISNFRNTLGGYRFAGCLIDVNVTMEPGEISFYTKALSVPPETPAAE